MAEFTKERLQEIAEDGFLKHGEAKAMARQMLAGLEQEPVHQVLSGDAWVDLSKGAMKSQSRVGATIRTLYVAPQLPQPAVDNIGEISVGRLPTMNQDEYPGLGDWWVRLRIGDDADEVLARVYGATPQEANARAEALARRAVMLQGAEPVSQPCTLRDGWVAVPVEPTMEMLDEFDSIIDYGTEDSKDAWRRLIAVAPRRRIN